jgi:hypothetical protein
VQDCSSIGQKSCRLDKRLGVEEAGIICIGEQAGRRLQMCKVRSKPSVELTSSLLVVSNF